MISDTLPVNAIALGRDATSTDSILCKSTTKSAGILEKASLVKYVKEFTDSAKRIEEHNLSFIDHRVSWDSGFTPDSLTRRRRRGIRTHGDCRLGPRPWWWIGSGPVGTSLSDSAPNPVVVVVVVTSSSAPCNPPNQETLHHHEIDRTGQESHEKSHLFLSSDRPWSRPASPATPSRCTWSPSSRPVAMPPPPLQKAASSRTHVTRKDPALFEPT